MLDQNDIRVVEGVFATLVGPMQQRIHDAIEKSAEKSNAAITQAATTAATAASAAATAVATAAAAAAVAAATAATAAAAAVVRHEENCPARVQIQRLLDIEKKTEGIVLGIQWTTRKIIGAVVALITVGAAVMTLVERIAKGS